MGSDPLQTKARQAGPVTRIARKVWRRLVAKNLTASDDYEKLDRFYAMEDPWEMGSTREQLRFAQTNAVIEDRLRHVGSVLENRLWRGTSVAPPRPDLRPGHGHRRLRAGHRPGALATARCGVPRR